MPVLLESDSSFQSQALSFVNVQSLLLDLKLLVIPFGRRYNILDTDNKDLGAVQPLL